MLTIRLHPQWEDAATTGLGESLRDDTAAIQQQVNQGVAQLWEIQTDKGTSWMVTRVEPYLEGQELVICCYRGCDLKTVSDLIVRCARAQGFDSIRYHTQRKGLNRLVMHLDFMPYETIYRKKLNSTGASHGRSIPIQH